MRTEGFRGALLSTLIISALIPTCGSFLTTIMNPTTGGLPRRNAKKEVRKMKSKLMVLGIAGIAAILLSAVTVAPALHAGGKPGPEIPFVGMSMTYYSNFMGNFVSRPVVVLKYYPENDSILIRDMTDWMMVNVENREAYWATGWYEDKVPFAVEYWIPTDVKVGSHVGILDNDAVVTGSTVLSVEGKPVDCWKLYATGTGMQDTWYYEKRTGLWIAASWVEWDENGTPINNWGGHLASTNVPL